MGYTIPKPIHSYYKGHPQYDPVVATQVKNHHEQFGGFNQAPPGWREITEKEFVQGKFFCYPHLRSEFRQLFDIDVKSETGSPLRNARLYFYHDGTGVAMMEDHWAGKIRYFAFGCDHKYEALDGPEAGHLGRCEHASKCKKCGHKKVVDSSD